MRLAPKLLELAPFAAVALILVVVQWTSHGWLYPASDDPYIYLGYVKRVLTDPPALFSYNPGEHSAGTTGLLYYYLLILTSAVSRVILFFLPLERVLLITLFATNTVLFLLGADRFLRLWRALVPDRSPGALPLGLLFLAFTAHPSFLWGVFSGLENPLTVFLALLVAERLVRRAPVWQSTLAAAGLGATRPETIPLLLVVPIIGVLAESPPVTHPLRRAAASAGLFLGTLVALALPCRLVTGRWLPSSLGTRARVDLLEDPTAFLHAFERAVRRTDYWTSDWLLLAYAAVAVATGLFLWRRRLAPLAIALGVLGMFVLRALLGLFDFNVEDRYVSHLWPLLALPFALLIREAAAPLATRVGRPAALSLTALLIAVSALPISEFLRRFEYHVDLMDQIVVQPSLWMREQLPTGSRICMEPAGAIRVFTDFYLVDAVGLTTTHRHGFRGTYPRFLLENRVDYVFDRRDPGDQVVSAGLGRELKAWAIGLPWGDIRLYEIDARFRGDAGG